MRVNRLGKYRSKRKRRSMLSWMFYIALPVLAMAAALYMTDALKKPPVDAVKALGSGQEAVDTFNQVFDLKEKQFYRIEFKSFNEMALAEKFVKSLKADKLNAFILKEDGFKVIYGIYCSSEEAAEVSTMLEAKKKDNTITPVRLSGVSFKYGTGDSKFVEIVRNSDELMDSILKAKSRLSREYAAKYYDDYENKLNAIISDEDKLPKYLEAVKEAQVGENLQIFKAQYIKLLMDFEKSGIELDVTKKDYYKLQNSMLLQVKSYRDFIERLSV